VTENEIFSPNNAMKLMGYNYLPQKQKNLPIFQNLVRTGVVALQIAGKEW
jgi:hypothetical protein